MLDRLARLPASTPGSTSSLLWAVTLVSFATGIVGWATGTLVGGVVALWSFSACAVGLALVLPLPYALASPLYMGIAGWLIDMLPFVILIGWTAVVLRWAFALLRARRLPNGNRWRWLPVFLVVWTGLGVLVITSLDFKHFLLLLGIQFIASGALLLVADELSDLEARSQLASGLIGFVVLLSAAVFLQWIGVPIDELRNSETRQRVEVAYGVDAFPNNIGMIKYARSAKAGNRELKSSLDRLAEENSSIPQFDAFQPKFQAFENSLVVRFEGSARKVEDDLARLDIELLYDNVGLAPANTVPRMRSFPRNALTYAGISAALLPLAFFLSWTGAGSRKAIGQLGIAACLFGAAFSLARGAWIAILIGILYLLVDGAVTRRQKTEVAIAFMVAALVLTFLFLFKYGVDPVTGRAGGGASINTREDLYRDTLQILRGDPIYAALGYGTERPRTESGTTKEGTRYVPRAGSHSTYLNYLFRTGVPGALAILGLYGVAWLHSRSAARLKEGSEKLFATMAAAGVVIAAAHAVILSLYVEPIYTLTISLLLGLAMAGNLDLPVPVLPWRKRTETA
jgi:ABC-type multidrug transport system fused ATPase/permease subunit